MRYLLLTTILALATCEPVYAASVVSSGTFQAYTTQHRVTNDGTGASGTWPINVSGTSTAFSTTPTVCTAQSATGVDAHGNATGCYTPPGTYSLPTATSSTLGGVKPDGTTLDNSSGVISVHNPLNQNTTGSAAKLTTGRTIGMTGPITWTSPTFDGSGNVTAAGTVTSQTGTGSTFVMSASPTITGTCTMPSGVGSGGIIGNDATTYLSIASDSAIGTTGNIVYFNGHSRGGGLAGIEQHYGQGYQFLRVGSSPVPTTFDGSVSVNNGANTVYRCTGATNFGLLTVNSALCVTGFVTTSLKLD